MTRRIYVVGPLVAAVTMGLLFLTNSTQTRAQDARGGAQDILANPDAHAWKLFEIVNQPVNKNDPFSPVQWERWALAQRVYPDEPDPRDPPTWAEASAPGEFEPEALPLQLAVRAGGSPHGEGSARGPGAGLALPDPSTLDKQRNETRLNQATFDFIVNNKLFYIEGQEEMFNNGTAISFPVESQEVKAQWRLIEKNDAHKYHTRKISRNGTDEYWGLTALHITTKDLPNWFWATWEHTDNEGREAVVPSRDRAGRPATLQAPWTNYVLRGTQVDFVDSTGRPTILANSQVERGFQNTSSCITCHARASIGPRPGLEFGTGQSPDAVNRLSIFLPNDEAPNGYGAIGRPDPTWFNQTETNPPARLFLQTDFVWSVFRAKRAKPLHERTSSAVIAGKWRYRSYLNDPTLDDVTKLLFGDGSMEFKAGATADEFRGEASFDQLKLNLEGSILTGSPQRISFRGTGIDGTGTAGWIYDYIGYKVPSWPNGVNQVEAIVGSVVRSARHGTSPAGVVASFIMVKAE